MSGWWGFEHALQAEPRDRDRSSAAATGLAEIAGRGDAPVCGWFGGSFLIASRWDPMTLVQGRAGLRFGLLAAVILVVEGTAALTLAPSEYPRVIATDGREYLQHAENLIERGVFSPATTAPYALSCGSREGLGQVPKPLGDGSEGEREVDTTARTIKVGRVGSGAVCHLRQSG